jgi:hypothetical protein
MSKRATKKASLRKPATKSTSRSKPAPKKPKTVSMADLNPERNAAMGLLLEDCRIRERAMREICADPFWARYGLTPPRVALAGPNVFHDALRNLLLERGIKPETTLTRPPEYVALLRTWFAQLVGSYRHERPTQESSTNSKPPTFQELVLRMVPREPDSIRRRDIIKALRDSGSSVNEDSVSTHALPALLLSGAIRKVGVGLYTRPS